MSSTTQPERDARRRTVARLIREGYSYAEIAEREGVSKSTVARDVKHLRETWREEIERDVTAYAAERYGALKAIRREAMQAWQQSKSSDPDAQLLRVLLRCEKDLRKLLNLSSWEPSASNERRMESLVEVIEATDDATDYSQFDGEPIR